MRGNSEKVQQLIRDFKTDQKKRLILVNDEVNTFDHVIVSLIKVLKHSPEQAEQCAYLTHYKGSCQVKTGSMSELQGAYRALVERDLNVLIR